MWSPRSRAPLHRVVGADYNYPIGEYPETERGDDNGGYSLILEMEARWPFSDAHPSIAATVLRSAADSRNCRRKDGCPEREGRVDGRARNGELPGFLQREFATAVQRRARSSPFVLVRAGAQGIHRNHRSRPRVRDGLLGDGNERVEPAVGAAAGE